MSDKIEKITLIVTSFNGDPVKLKRLIDSAKGFDEMLIHIDGNGISRHDSDGKKINEYYVPYHYTIPGGYNLLMGFVTTEWVCCFCDDDYFEEEGLKKMLHEIHTEGGLNCGVCTFRTFVTGYAPWRDKGSVLVELINRLGKILILKGVEVKARRWYGYKGNLTVEHIKYQSDIPHGAFFRKVVWDKVGGMTGDIAHDWILWLKMARWGVEFKYYPYIVYTYERREDSSWFSQFKTIAHGSMRKLREIVDKEATV